mgnify:CR=1 FL=1
MIRITQKSYRNLIFFCDLFNDGYHRAGIGMSEHSDAVVAIVSEETGSISVAVGGMLKRHLAPETLDRLLRNELKTDEDDGEKKSDLFPLVAALFNRGKKEGTE